MNQLHQKRNIPVKHLQQKALCRRYRIKPSLAGVIAIAHFGEVRHG